MLSEKDERRWKVYCHTNKINGKKYFGITSTSLNARFQNGRGYSGCRYFNYAIQKYGWDNFEHELISDNLTKEEAMSLEEILVFFNMTQDSRYGYNIKDGGDTRRTTVTFIVINYRGIWKIFSPLGLPF